MAALSPTVVIYKQPFGKNSLTVVTCAVTSAGGHLPAATLGFREAVTILGVSSTTGNVACHALINSQDGSNQTTPGDVWLDSAATNTYTVAVVGR